MRPERGKSVNWDETENLYIEGDNLEALKLMRETYAGKVKLVYIDPPYNTGHDFINVEELGERDALDVDERVLEQGIVLCKDMNKAFVDYVVRDYDKPMGVATYKTSRDMSEELLHALPPIEDLEAILEGGGA